MKRLSVLLVPIALAFGVLSSSASAAAQSRDVHVQKAVGPYRLVLQVGPAETMSMHKKGSTGEVMLGGKMATCAAPDGTMGGMSMGSERCNRHIEVHVFQRSSGKVVTNAHVNISLSDGRTHRTSRVPIMSMVGATAGVNDLHYGNNIRAGADPYLITVHINRLVTTFSVRLT